MSLQGLMEADIRFSSKLKSRKSKGFWRALLIFFAHSGDSWFWLMGLAIVWFFSSEAWHDRAAFLAIGLFILAIVVIILKFTVRRPRPKGEWGQIYRATDPHSFPSGHAARAAALAVMAIGIGPMWFALLLIFWAPLVGLARVSLGVHYLSDVVVGWLIGITMGLTALALYPFAETCLPFLF
ncbi:MAG: phosphatase PAP2 family protein [Chloroflexota bacterium]